MSKKEEKDKFTLELVRVFEGHSGAVTSLVCGEIVELSFHGHNHFLSSLALNSDSTKLISGSWDKTIWDIPSSKLEKIFKGHTKDIICIASLIMKD